MNIEQIEQDVMNKFSSYQQIILSGRIYPTNLISATDINNMTITIEK